MPSLFGWLNNFSWWTNLPYPQLGAVLRGLKAGLAVLVGIALAGISQGVLKLPADWSPAIVFVVTALLQAEDKYLRESQIAKTAAVSDAALGPTAKTTSVNTDATVTTVKKH
jgi:hypothetical protein